MAGKFHEQAPNHAGKTHDNSAFSEVRQEVNTHAGSPASADFVAEESKCASSTCRYLAPLSLLTTRLTGRTGPFRHSRRRANHLLTFENIPSSDGCVSISHSKTDVLRQGQGQALCQFDIGGIDHPVSGLRYCRKLNVAATEEQVLRKSVARHSSGRSFHILWYRCPLPAGARNAVSCDWYEQ